METSIDVYQGLMELNVLGTISITKQVLPHMTERGSGGIVTVSSIAGLIGVPLSTGYAASKHALQVKTNCCSVWYFELPSNQEMFNNVFIFIRVSSNPSNLN